MSFTEYKLTKEDREMMEECEAAARREARGVKKPRQRRFGSTRVSCHETDEGKRFAVIEGTGSINKDTAADMAAWLREFEQWAWRATPE